jgi:uncharacterized cupin superfamily protein
MGSLSVSKPHVFESKAVQLKTAPIRPEWIIEGAPAARNHVLFVSEDRSSVTLFWECTAGVFRWIYDEEEIIYVIDGGMTLTYPNGEARTVGTGDVVYFAAGDTAVWTVESHVRKIAVFRRPLPRTLGQLLAIYQKAMARLAPATRVPRGMDIPETA